MFSRCNVLMRHVVMLLSRMTQCLPATSYFFGLGPFGTLMSGRFLASQSSECWWPVVLRGWLITHGNPINLRAVYCILQLPVRRVRAVKPHSPLGLAGEGLLDTALNGMQRLGCR
jgi:hypothetical protein